MEVLIRAAQLFLSLSILVIIHEFGHYLFARLFKTRVEKFYLFFNPWFSIWKKKIGETEYGIGWLPLGGYVKIAGMIDESMDKDQMKQPEQPWEFRSKKTWQRLLIMVGGVLFNLILAGIIYTLVLWTWGDKYLPNTQLTEGVVASQTAKDMGFKDGDHIISIGDKTIESFFDIVPEMVLNEGEKVLVNRNGEQVTITMTPSRIATMVDQTKGKQPLFSPRIPFIVHSFSDGSGAEKAGMLANDKIIAIDSIDAAYYDIVVEELKGKNNKTVVVTVLRNGQKKSFNVKLSEDAKLGIYATPLSDLFEFKTNEYTLGQAIPAGLSRSKDEVSNYIKQLKLIFNPETKAYKSLGGFGTIASVFPTTWNWEAFWSMTAFLSIILAVMNILPIPALDGGHVLFLLYEMITRRKPSEKFLEYAQMAGLILVLALVLYANLNDVLRLFK